MKKLERQRYVTRKMWGTHPPGTECWAEREEGKQLILTFDDESSVEAIGCHASGLESDICSLFQQADFYLAC